MAVSKAEVLKALGIFKEMQDAYNEEKFASKVAENLGDDISELKEKVAEMQGTVDLNETNVNSHEYEINELRNELNQLNGDDELVDEEIERADIAEIFNS